MQRSTSILALAVLSLTLASCVDPEEEARPFAGGPRRSLDHPPRYGDNRYMDPRTRDMPADVNVDPSTIPPGANTNAPAGITGGPLDPGLKVAPPGTDSTTTTTTTTTVVPPAGGTLAAPPPPAPGDVPYARPVPGKPGFVHNPHDGKILDVTGMRPGTKVKDPQTGAMFRVP